MPSVANEKTFGTNIAGTVDVEALARFAWELPGVALARDYKFMCSSLGQELIEEDIKKQKLDRVVVAACSPHLHEKTFRRACSNAGLNPYLFQMANIREHVSWVHEDREEATAKAVDIVRMMVERILMSSTYPSVSPMRTSSPMAMGLSAERGVPLKFPIDEEEFYR